MINKILNNKNIVNGSIILIGLSALVAIMYQFQSFLMPFTVAILLTFLIIPTQRSLKKKKVYTFYLILFFLGIILLVVIISSLVNNEGKDLGFDNSTKSIANQLDLLEGEGFQFGDKFITFDEILPKESLKRGIEKSSSSLVRSTGNFLSGFAMVILFLIFMIPSHDMLIQNISKRMRPSVQARFKKILGKIERGIRDYLLVKSVISIITAGISLVILLIFGVNFPVIFALLIFILNFIPNIGSIFAVGVILIVHLFNTGFSTNFILLSIFLILTQIIIGNIIEPKMSGKKMNLSPVAVLLSLFFWGYLWGIWGMFFAVPLTVSIKIIFENLNNTIVKN